ILGRLEIPGHVHGIASMLHVVLADCDCDRNICTMSHSKISETIASPAVTAMKRGLQNRGVDIMGRETFLVSGTHTNAEIDFTLGAFQDAMSAVRADGLI
ncbi:MAG TPA: hypothetical protein DHW65_03700, partial [Dehalococcoidia bacterium]|nr:hypothetical protein [Dehalococcoidia bacterium]